MLKAVIPLDIFRRKPRREIISKVLCCEFKHVFNMISLVFLRRFLLFQILL
jgi:hypothetical protein